MASTVSWTEHDVWWLGGQTPLLHLACSLEISWSPIPKVILSGFSKPSTTWRRGGEPDREDPVTGHSRAPLKGIVSHLRRLLPSWHLQGLCFYSMSLVCWKRCAFCRRSIPAIENFIQKIQYWDSTFTSLTTNTLLFQGQRVRLSSRNDSVCYFKFIFAFFKKGKRPLW